MNATFGRDIPPHGCLGLISQSGALCAALLDYAKGRGIGLLAVRQFRQQVRRRRGRPAAVAGRGRQDAGHHDVRRGDRRAARGSWTRPTRSRTVRTPSRSWSSRAAARPKGAAAAASHTGSLAGSDEVYNALMTQAGVFRVETVARAVRPGRGVHRSVLARRAQDGDRHQRRRAGHHGHRRLHPPRPGTGQVPGLHRRSRCSSRCRRWAASRTRGRDRGRPARPLPRGAGRGHRRRNRRSGPGDRHPADDDRRRRKSPR